VARQYLQDGPYLDPPIAAPLSADVATTAVLMWNPLQFTKFYGDEAKRSRVYVVEAGGLITTSASASALTISPSITTTNAAGTTLGASIAQTTPVSSLSGPWVLRSWWTVTAIGAPGGNNASMIGEGIFQSGGVAATANSGLTVTFGGTAAVFDQSVANAIAITKTLSVAGSFTTHWCLGYWMNSNARPGRS
jgi:hypothetical protein